MTVRILGIDPGISSLGLSCIELDPYEKKPFKLIYAETANGEYNEFGIRADNPHQVRAKGLTRVYSYVFDKFEPHVVACEDNFLGINPASFKRLIEVVSYFNIHTVTNKKDAAFRLVLPRLAKQIVDADFRGATKDDVKIGLAKCEFLDLNGFDLDLLTEHAHDAILLAVYLGVQYYKDLGWDLIHDKKSKASAKT
ncbi:putative crossover junction endodeoxyribonuclease [Aeromonas phage D3]|uniref:Crossover junction endodeoxyribonuclease n=2 Tax=Ludhianavirus TaxID=3044751 RepID=A0A514TW73_9CAUD|nr:putative crossover junction endodeoxyribonuclease [Aeromonas phage D3]YP_010668859.1 putative crossover junction endodeoxyribonuclease [Aeromonas phage D6]QDJ97110.1 putative crossover junction endodeoxyribonuclease [Aeromonas phage D3]QDJ97271.1 putative crossover junction endodeoxyribonuclease [Aeromonas phage D6]QEP52416.1 crossover junction endodeoxyribonuclease [Aeromonas phage D9]